MSLHFNAFSLTLFMSGVAALLVALILFQRKQASIFWFALMMLASSVWAIFYSFELSSSSLSQMLFWINLEYIGISFIPATWIMFVLNFIGKKDWLTPRNVMLVFLFPALAISFVWTNLWHHIHYESVSLDTSGPFPLLAIIPGPWYHVHTVYFYFLLALGVFLMTRHYTQSELIYRKQTRTVLIGAMIPWITNFLYLLGVRPHQHIDLTPYSFVVTALVIAYGLTRYQLLAIVPFAREKLIDNIREGMLVLDSRQRVIDLNAAMRRFLNPSDDSIIGENFANVFPTQSALQHLILIKTDSRKDIVLTDENGTRVYEVSVTVLLDDKKEFVGTLLVFWDITNRRKTTEKLKRQADELQSLNDLKNRLFSIISHDLRSPLANLINILHAAQDNSFSETDLRMMLEMLSKDIGNTSSMLDNLLSWARSQLQGETIHPEAFALKELVDSKVDLFEKRAVEKEIRLVNTISSDVVLFADKNMIKLVLRNLISNALKFCWPHAVITISAVAQGEYTIVSIQDTGIGMDEAMQARLFELGAPGAAGTSHEKGTGLGLKLCKDFIEKNHGKIWAQSEPGKGSTFFFQLPNREMK